MTCDEVTLADVLVDTAADPVFQLYALGLGALALGAVLFVWALRRR